MGIFNKLFFWKKDLDFEELARKELDRGMGKGGMPIQDVSGIEEKSPFEDQPTDMEQPTSPFATAARPSPYTAAQQPSGLGSRDMELLNSKLDTIKALLTSLDQRVANLERAAGPEQKKERLW